MTITVYPAAPRRGRPFAVGGDVQPGDFLLIDGRGAPLAQAHGAPLWLSAGVPAFVARHAAGQPVPVDPGTMTVEVRAPDGTSRGSLTVTVVPSVPA